MTESRERLLPAGTEESERHLMSVMAHEVSNAVTPLRLHAQTLAQAGLEGRAGEAAVAVQVLADRLAALAAEMLDAARLREDRLALHPAGIDLQEEALKVVQAISPLAEVRRVHLRLEPMPPCPVMADGPRMQQVIANLVQNALEATPAGGRVRVEVSSREGQARVEVVDTGVGLRPEEAERLFKPFPQLPGRRAGFGLGLFICRGIVEAHGGRISCNSAGPGRGATFTVEIPPHDGVGSPAGFEGLEEP